ncbi:MAG: KH domain-containing protein [Oscillospiraceae bacterium]|jgi:predicted RNA-binding protein YlqC (UPF0109 family)|nr:KH domain-containing protein [Oscillospiraceae bacterium]
MKQMLESIAKGLVENKDKVSVEISEPDENGMVTYSLCVDPKDAGAIIGREGKIAEAIRTVVCAAAASRNLKIALKID